GHAKAAHNLQKPVRIDGVIESAAYARVVEGWQLYVHEQIVGVGDVDSLQPGLELRVALESDGVGRAGHRQVKLALLKHHCVEAQVAADPDIHGFKRGVGVDVIWVVFKLPLHSAAPFADTKWSGAGQMVLKIPAITLDHIAWNNVGEVHGQD